MPVTTNTESREELRVHGPFRSGWHRLRLEIRSRDRQALRKRAELFAITDTGQQRLDAFEWNRELREEVLIWFEQSMASLELRTRGDFGPVIVDRWECTPASTLRILGRAIRLKLNLLRSYNCFWPVVSRGGKLLLRGRFAEFGRKLLRGIPDSRTMRIEVKRAAEVSAMWWRRGALPADEIARLKDEAEAIDRPRPIGVLIPTDPTRVDHARQAILSVLRQVYPHWELSVAWPNAATPALLKSLAKWDSRIRIVPSAVNGLAGAVRTAAELFESDRFLVLPPDWELGEAALLRLAQSPAEESRSMPGTGPALLSRDRYRAGLPQLEATSAYGVVRWADSLAPAGLPTVREPIAFPLDEGRALQSKPRHGLYSNPLILAADVRGIGGWDHVAYEILKGLRSADVDLRMHDVAKVFPDLLPPNLRPEIVKRSHEPQVIVAPPFLVKRFAPDTNTAVLTMWETDRIDPAHAAVLNRARLVIVPSRWGMECFRASGVTVPIEVVPLGFDPLVFHPTGDSAELCTFGTAGALSAGGLRKNVGSVVDWFREAFPTEPDVRLRVKISPNCPPFEVANDPRIDIVRANLPSTDLARWNRSLTAYVNASYAEGFGLHLLEAMACGVPIISAHSSGLTEYFDERVGFTVPHRMIEARNEYYRGQWADPDAEAIIDTMRSIYRATCSARERGEAAAARAARYTWRETGRKLLAALERHGLLEPKR